jgi:glycosyltransferase involved in cell wall biosynthesis
MRVLMVSDVYSPRVNGVSTSIETFRQSLHRFGVEVRLVVPSYGNDAHEQNVVRVPGRALPGDPEDRLVGWRSMHRAVLAAAEDCDLIHIQTPFIAHYAGLKAARKLNLPVVATYHTLFEEYLQHYAPLIPRAWLRGQARGFSRRQCNALDGVIVPSSAMRERLTAYGVKTPLHVLPTGIPLERFTGGNRQRFRREYGILSTRPVALFVGRVAHEKNIEFLLQALLVALTKRPDLLLVIAGEGPASDDLKARVKVLGLRDSVQFIGYLDRQQALPDCYAAADVFVFASVTETQGLVLLEAMAAGLPVIALSEMGTRDILEAQRGAITPRAEPESFGIALADFINRPSAWAHLQQEAPEYAKEWSDVAMAGRLAGLYQQLAGAKISAESLSTVTA